MCENDSYINKKEKFLLDKCKEFYPICIMDRNHNNSFCKYILSYCYKESYALCMNITKGNSKLCKSISKKYQIREKQDNSSLNNTKEKEENISRKKFCEEEYVTCLSSPQPQVCINTDDGRTICSNEEKCKYFYEKCLKNGYPLPYDDLKCEKLPNGETLCPGTAPVNNIEKQESNCKKIFIKCLNETNDTKTCDKMYKNCLIGINGSVSKLPPKEIEPKKVVPKEVRPHEDIFKEKPQTAERNFVNNMIINTITTIFKAIFGLFFI